MSRPAPLPGLRLPKRHFNALDLSRLLAAVLVLFWHYQHFFVPPGAYDSHVDRAIQPLYGLPLLTWAYDHGAVAVQYFWAVSGFVFAHVYLAEPSTGGRFWLARVARLWPLHLLTLGVVAVLQAVVLWRWGGFFVYAWNDAYHFAMQLVLAHYWGFQANQSFNGPSWSLSTEILAYAAFWLLLPALRRLAGLGIALAIAAGMTALLVLHTPDPDVLTCLLYFFAGVAFYIAMLRRLIPAGALPAMALALAGLSAALWNALGDGFYASLPGIFAALSLAVWLDVIDRKDRLRFGKQLGDASYGIYLWHFPLQLMALLAVPAVSHAARNPLFLLAFVGAAIVAGFASHRWIERPAQRAVMKLAGRFGAGRTAAVEAG